MIFPSSHDFHGHLTGWQPAVEQHQEVREKAAESLGMLVRRAPRTEPLINESLSTKNLGIWAPKWAPKSVDFRGKMNEIEHEHDKPLGFWGDIMLYIYIYDII